MRSMAQFGPVGLRVGPDGDLAFLQLWSTMGAQAAIERICYRITNTTGSGPTIGQALTALGTVFGPLMTDCMSKDATFSGVGWQSIGVSPRRQTCYDNTTSAIGARGTNVLPGQVCPLISLGTSFTGRAYRGRVYLPFPASGDVDVGGVPKAVVLTAANAVAAAMLLPRLIGVAGNQCTLIPVLKQRLAPFYTDLATASASSRYATQRRRGSYGKVNSVPF